MPKGPGANIISVYTNPAFQGGSGVTATVGSVNVNIAGLPIVRGNDPLPGPATDGVPLGAPTVRINGMAAVRMGDSTQVGGNILTGITSVLIGD